MLHTKIITEHESEVKTNTHKAQTIAMFIIFTYGYLCFHSMFIALHFAKSCTLTI